MSTADEPAPRRAAPADQPRHRRRPAVPPALAALLVTVAIVGLAWALLVPPFQSPDETGHFAYAQSLATRFALPSNTPGRPEFSTDQEVADAAVRASSLAFHVDAVRPNWSAAAFHAYLAQTRSHLSQSNGGGPNPLAVNPPLVYLYSTLAYRASGSANLFGRLYAMSAWGVLLLLGTVVGAWLLAGEVFGARLAQLVAAAVAGLVPMVAFMSTSINPDALMITLWTFALWLGARLIRRGWSTATAVALCGVTAGAVLTKATSYALIPAVVLALGLAWRAYAPERRRALLGPAAAALATLAVPVLGWVLYTKAQGRPTINTVNAPVRGGPSSGFHLGGFISYVWQFYLPRLPFLTPINTGGGSGLAVYEVWLKEAWAAFGWLDVYLPAWIYTVLGALTAAVGVGAAAIVRTLRGGTRLALLGFFALALLALLFGLHLTAYRSIVGDQGPLLQGRYLLPVISLFGLAVALVVVRIPRPWRGAAAGATLAGLLLVQVLALAAVTRTYYS